MTFLRFFLFPLAIIYSIITSARNFLFDIGVFSSTKYRQPTIGVGNLSVGGTGKSVCVDYLASLLKTKSPVAILSRGYGRATKGYIEATDKSTFRDIGDEPKMFKLKHPTVRVAVAERRRLGMKTLLETAEENTVFVWDDCYQHRWASPKMMFLLTPFDHLFVEDYHLPMGNLRERRRGKKRADVVIVTKSPKELTNQKKKEIAQKLKLCSTQYLFFSHIRYSNKIKSLKQSFSLDELKQTPFILVTGISNPLPLLNHLRLIKPEFKHLQYADHHPFSKKDIRKIEKQAKGQIILTTEKDFVRLSALLNAEQLFYLSIEMDFDIEDKKQLDKIIFETISKPS